MKQNAKETQNGTFQAKWTSNCNSDTGHFNNPPSDIRARFGAPSCGFSSKAESWRFCAAFFVTISVSSNGLPSLSPPALAFVMHDDYPVFYRGHSARGEAGTARALSSQACVEASGRSGSTAGETRSCSYRSSSSPS